ncbi:MAG: STAS domain-containing protein [Candidatus Brocadiaceae bacterium]|jgi:anti-sigma B factor antagonist
MARLDVTERAVQGVPVLGLSGSLDVDTAPELRRRLLAHTRQQAAPLVLDLSGLEFMDTGGLATLIEAELRAREQGGGLVVFGLTSRALDVFEMAKVESMFTIVEDEEAAAKAATRPR